MSKKKQLYIFCGCNGAGKTTASFTVLPEVLKCKEFVNADEIAKGLSRFNPEKVAIDAGKLMLMRMEELLAQGVSFAFETTLATKGYKRFIKRAQDSGYRVTLIYFWLNSTELAIQRVAKRVAEGGHNIPEEVIRRRYVSGITNLFEIYMDCVDYWMLADNSQAPRVIVAEGGRNIETEIHDLELYNIIKSNVRERNKRAE